MYATYCVYEGDPEVEICGEPQDVGDNCETVWVDDPLPDPWPPPEPGDPCADPASGCNPGGGGGEPYPQPEPVRDIINNLPEGCIKNVVNELIQKDCKNEISTMINWVFGA